VGQPQNSTRWGDCLDVSATITTETSIATAPYQNSGDGSSFKIGAACVSSYSFTDTTVTIQDVVGEVSPWTAPSNPCFSKSESVLLESGQRKQLPEIKIGDVIQVSDYEGQMSFAPVVFIPHPSDNSVVSIFLKFVTRSGRTIKMTPSHIVFISRTCDAYFELTKAKDVVVGQCLKSSYGHEEIVSIGPVVDTGIHTVVTAHPHGCLVVNDFLASSFAVNHHAVNVFYHMHRAVFHLVPSSWLSSNVLRDFHGFLGKLAASAGGSWLV